MATERRDGLGRRELLTAAVATASVSLVRAQAPVPATPAQTTLADVPLAEGTTITVERRDDIALIGINRPAKQNRLDSVTRKRLGEALYAYEHDASLRAAVLFGHGERFTRGIDVDEAQVSLLAPPGAAPSAPTIDILGKATPPTGKPVICVAHGDTWNLGHEIYLACDIRVATANTRFGQDENTHGRFPGGGATVRFVREVNHPHCRMMYDTFHANIEEKKIPDAIRSCTKETVHVHISENDRGTPGEGHVAWDETFDTLKQVGYDGWMVVEAFGLALPALAAATKIWRRMFRDEEQLSADALTFMKREWGKRC